MQYIEQKEDWDCVIACLAMVTDKTYQEVFDDFISYFDYFGCQDGVDDEAFYDYLSEHGFVYSVFRKRYDPQANERKTWPMAPFAPLHVVGVVSGGVAHSVMMTWNGVIYDPDDTSKIGLWEYEDVNEIVGIWPKPNR